MQDFYGLAPACALLPGGLMASVAGIAVAGRCSVTSLWRLFQGLAWGALVLTAGLALAGTRDVGPLPGVLHASPFSLYISLLVQLLGTVIGGFSERYLQGEPGQHRYVAGLAGALAAVHLLLLADHWAILIVAWAAVGVALQPLLCFYSERPFAQLAAFKKRIVDRAADVLLIGAAILAWREVGSGALPALWAHVEAGPSLTLQMSALLLVLAILVRTALLPVHGWLIQVMEAPTPVSALLHAGVVNLGGYVLIRFAPLLEQALAARALLVTFGLSTALLAGMVMLTRVSIKVRLAWSTVAQMGFMLLECALGLYSLAALHLLGHSLYKAHAFLAASTVVRETRLQALYNPSVPSTPSLMLAPFTSVMIVLGIQSLSGLESWPWWWSGVLGLAWAPLLWLPESAPSRAKPLVAGSLMVVALTAAALLAHGLPLGVADSPHEALGLVTLAGMTALYMCLAVLQRGPERLSVWRRWSYAGFYVDEAFTRLTLRLWPAAMRPAGQASAGELPHPLPRG